MKFIVEVPDVYIDGTRHLDSAFKPGYVKKPMTAEVLKSIINNGLKDISSKQVFCLGDYGKNAEIIIQKISPVNFKRA